MLGIAQYFYLFTSYIMLLIFLIGQVLAYGQYYVTYVASDAAGNSAICSFKLFVLRKYLYYYV